MARVLYVHSRRNTFISIDRQALAERYEVVDYYQPGAAPRLGELRAGLRACDVVYGWFASWHTLAALTLARRMGKPSVLVIGGFDTAAMPEIGYGSQSGGLRRIRARRTIAAATRLITNSNYSLTEVESNLEIDPARVKVVYHGVPDRFAGIDTDADRDPLVLTVGNVDRANLLRKGLGPFVEAARLRPEADFVLAGGWVGDAGAELAARAGANARLTGYVEDAQLDDLFRSAAVYVQASAHEGFGLSLAEAMLAGAVPVTTRAGALPEVAGEVGIQIDEQTPEAIADGVAAALELGAGSRAAARRRVLAEFPYEARRDGICAEVELAIGARKAP